MKDVKIYWNSPPIPQELASKLRPVAQIRLTALCKHGIQAPGSGPSQPDLKCLDTSTDSRSMLKCMLGQLSRDPNWVAIHQRDPESVTALDRNTSKSYQPLTSRAWSEQHVRMFFQNILRVLCRSFLRLASTLCAQSNCVFYSHLIRTSLQHLIDSCPSPTLAKQYCRSFSNQMSPNYNRVSAMSRAEKINFIRISGHFSSDSMCTHAHADHVEVILNCKSFFQTFEVSTVLSSYLVRAQKEVIPWYPIPCSLASNIPNPYSD